MSNTNKLSGTSALHYAGMSDQGKVRTRNEDDWMADGEVFIVSDGMGGHPDGNLASHLVVSLLPDLLRQEFSVYKDWADPGNEEGLRSALRSINQELDQRNQERALPFGMGATVVIVVIQEGVALIGHLGDSRLYRLRNNTLELLTHDHSVIQYMLDRDLITPDLAKFHPARAQITQHVGMDIEPDPDIRRVSMRMGDRLLLCTDGLNGMLKDERIRSILQRYSNPQEAGEVLIRLANKSGGVDNTTVILVDWHDT